MKLNVLFVLALGIDQFMSERCSTPDHEIGECKSLKSCPEMISALANPVRGREEYLRQLFCGNGEKVCCDVKIAPETSAEKNTMVDLMEDVTPEIHLTDAVECDSGSFSSDDEFDLPSLPEVRVRNHQFGVEYTKCIGALINERYVLTAARCVAAEQGRSEFSVVAVRFGLNGSNSNIFKDFSVEEQILHPFHIEDDGINDVALLRLNSTVIDDNIQPTCLLPHADDVFGKPGDKLVTVGSFGAAKKGQGVLTTLLSSQQCMMNFQKDYANIAPYSLCTTDLENASSTCDNYDSVPVFFFSYGGHLLKGISSGQICADGQPKVFTNLAKYFDWILDNMRPWPISNVECTTPSGEAGNCVSLRYCPAVLEEFANPGKGLEEHLLKFICGDKQQLIFSDVSDVCCSTSSNPETLRNRNGAILNSTIQKGFFEPFRCGFQHRDDYFPENDDITLDEYPWIARLIIGPKDSDQELDHSLCTGSLINARYVITAASCLTNFEEIDTVRLGDFNQRNKTDCYVEEVGTDCSDYEDIAIEEKIVHPFYLSAASINNVALLRLNRTVVYTDYIRPICLPRPGTTEIAKPGDILHTSGWGWSRENYFVAVKKKVFSTLITNKQCRQMFRKNLIPTFITPFDMCTVDFANNTDFSCVFDHGGPLMFHNNFKWHIEGILSSSNSYVCNDDMPVRYTRLVKYFDWIQDNMRPWDRFYSYR